MPILNFDRDGYLHPLEAITSTQGLEILKTTDIGYLNEKWVGCIVAIGISNLTKTLWHVKFPPPRVAGPDFFMASVSKNEKGREEALEAAVQIVSCPPRLVTDSTEDPETIVFEHCKRTKFTPNRVNDGEILVIYFQFRRKGFNLAKLSELLKKESPKFGEIWALATLSAENSDFLLTELFPGHAETKMNLFDIFEATKQFRGSEGERQNGSALKPY